jgi:hypothetical protein
MKKQIVIEMHGVKVRCMPGVGATPVRRTYRAGSRRAGRSHPRHRKYLAQT